MDQFVIQKTVDDSSYKKYSFHHSQGFGYIILKKNESIWNLESINVYPTGRQLGSIFLTEVLSLENLSAQNMTVYPTSKDNKRFFNRHGFIIF